MNQVQKAIYEKVIKPELSKIAHDVDGIVVGVKYYQQTIDVQWSESSSGAFRTAKNLSIPKEGGGIYRQTIKVGDRVRIAFRNSNLGYPYISMIYDPFSTKSDYYTKSGVGIPKGLSL
jgi:hypothetical protein